MRSNNPRKIDKNTCPHPTCTVHYQDLSQLRIHFNKYHAVHGDVPDSQWITISGSKLCPFCAKCVIALSNKLGCASCKLQLEEKRALSTNEEDNQDLQLDNVILPRLVASSSLDERLRFLLEFQILVICILI